MRLARSRFSTAHRMSCLGFLSLSPTLRPWIGVVPSYVEGRWSLVPALCAPGPFSLGRGLGQSVVFFKLGITCVVFQKRSWNEKGRPSGRPRQVLRAVGVANARASGRGLNGSVRDPSRTWLGTRRPPAQAGSGTTSGVSLSESSRESPDSKVGQVSAERKAFWTIRPCPLACAREEDAAENPSEIVGAQALAVMAVPTLTRRAERRSAAAVPRVTAVVASPHPPRLAVHIHGGEANYGRRRQAEDDDGKAQP